MLDALLGRARLKEQIDELERRLATCNDEIERLESQLSSTDERRKEAIRDHQTAREEVHRLEDRIEQLEDRVERSTQDSEVTERGVHPISYRRMSRLLERLKSFDTGAEGAYSAMITSALPPEVSDHFNARQHLVREVIPCLCLFDDEGVIELALEPPLPPEAFEAWDRTFTLEDEWFVPSGRFAFSLVRSDLFAIGRYDGETLTNIEGFESDVMGRHSKGGYSQARFERRREEQIDRHLEQARTRIAAYHRDEPLILTGSKSVIDTLDVAADMRATVDASGSPDDALASAFEEFWTTTVHRL